MNEKTLILASSSVYRQKQLESLGLIFSSMPANIEEGIFHKRYVADLPNCALELAKEKAHFVFRSNQKAVVIGGDQIASFRGKRLGKTGNQADSLKALSEMNGGVIELYTAICILDENKEEMILEKTELHMKQWSQEDLLRYVQFSNPIDCAGSFKIEVGGIALFDKIVGNDLTAIEGIPLLLLAKSLEKRGLRFWQLKI